MGAQRAENIKSYLTTVAPEKIDSSRVQARDGGNKGKMVHFWFVPSGDLCKDQAEEAPRSTRPRCGHSRANRSVRSRERAGSNSAGAEVIAEAERREKVGEE